MLRTRFAPALLLVSLLGCKGQTHFPVEGAVTYKSKPVDGGMITFLGTGDHKGPMGGALIQAGKFDIPAVRGLEPGLYKVVVSWPGGVGVRTREQIEAGASTPAKEQLPAKYSDPEKTELHAEVKATPTNRIELNLD